MVMMGSLEKRSQFNNVLKNVFAFNKTGLSTFNVDKPVYFFFV